MSVNSEQELANHIAVGSSGEIIECIERRAAGMAIDLKERLLYGVLLLFPPFAEPEAAKQVFATLLESPLQFNAAVWDAFRYATLMADEDRAFEPVLTRRSHSAVASHMLSQVALAEGRFEAFSQLNHASRTIRQFPSNIIAALENGLAPGEADALKQAFNDSLLSGHAESDPPVSSVDGLLERLWDNQITGARLTRPYLRHLRERGVID
jgi:hypothetical protein